MSLIDLLRKLGILRFGADKGTYRNAVERPTALQMDDVLDLEKDLAVRRDGSVSAGRRLHVNSPDRKKAKERNR